MTAYRARELAETYEDLSRMYYCIAEMSQNAEYKQRGYRHMEVAQALYIAAEALEKRKGDRYGSRT